jgi:hypothetical protein
LGNVGDADPPIGLQEVIVAILLFLEWEFVAHASGGYARHEHGLLGNDGLDGEARHCPTAAALVIDAGVLARCGTGGHERLSQRADGGTMA